MLAFLQVTLSDSHKCSEIYINLQNAKQGTALCYTCIYRTKIGWSNLRTWYKSTWYWYLVPHCSMSMLRFLFGKILSRYRVTILCVFYHFNQLLSKYQSWNLKDFDNTIAFSNQKWPLAFFNQLKQTGLLFGKCLHIGTKFDFINNISLVFHDQIEEMCSFNHTSIHQDHTFVGRFAFNCE